MRNSSGSLAIFAAMRRVSSRVNCAARRHCVCCAGPPPARRGRSSPAIPKRSKGTDRVAKFRGLSVCGSRWCHTSSRCAKTTRCRKAQRNLRSALGSMRSPARFLISTDGGELCSDVMASNITDDPEYWQKRAEEARTLAEQMMDTHTKSLMLGIAASYEKIAKWSAERRDEPRLARDHGRERNYY